MVPEWPKGSDCKSDSVCFRWFESIPLHHLKAFHKVTSVFKLSNRFIVYAGVAQLVEHQPSKLGVESSSLFARSIFWSCAVDFCSRGSVVEHFLGKEEVTGSIPVVSSIFRRWKKWIDITVKYINCRRVLCSIYRLLC